MCKLREFWIWQVGDLPPRVCDIKPEGPFTNKERIYSVIEKSAADKLAEALVSCKMYANEYIDDFGFEHYISKVVDKALAEYRGESDERR